MTPKKPDPDDIALFRQAVKNVKPLGKTKAKVAPEPPRKPFRKRPQPAFQDEEPDSFSDFDREEPVLGEALLSFARSGISSRLMRSLKRGHEPYEAVLDLHGQTILEARQALYRFLNQGVEQGLKRVLVVHGKGRGKSAPVLKNKVNNWLRQTELVLAFCTAQISDGGTGAVYVLLKSPLPRAGEG